MYKLIELTDNGQRVNEAGWVANITNEAIESQNVLIVVQKIKNDYFLIGKKFEGEVFEWLQEKEQIKHAFNISTFEGYVKFEVGYVTDDYSFMVEEQTHSVENMIEDLEGFEIERGCICQYDKGEELRPIPFEYYEMSQDNVKEFIKVLGYEYTEL